MTRRTFKFRSTLGRSIDLRYPSNRYIVGVSGIIAVVGPILEIVEGSGLDSHSIIEAIQLSLAAFLAWAIGRELDPDFTFTANVAVPLAVVVALIWEPPAMMALVGTLMAIRVVNRSVGPALTYFDSVLLVLGAGLVAGLGYFFVGFGIAIGIGLNHFLPNPDRPRALIVAALALISTFIGLMTVIFLEDFEAPSNSVLSVLIAISILYIYAIHQTPTPKSVSDVAKRPLARSRIGAGQYLAFFIAAATIPTFKTDGIHALSALWAAFLAMGLRAIYQQLTSQHTNFG